MQVKSSIYLSSSTELRPKCKLFMQYNTIFLFPPYLKIVCNKIKTIGTKQTEQINKKTLGKCR